MELQLCKILFFLYSKCLASNIGTILVVLVPAAFIFCLIPFCRHVTMVLSNGRREGAKEQLISYGGKYSRGNFNTFKVVKIKCRFTIIFKEILIPKLIQSSQMKKIKVLE